MPGPVFDDNLPNFWDTQSLPGYEDAPVFLKQDLGQHEDQKSIIEPKDFFRFSIKEEE